MNPRRAWLQVLCLALALLLGLAGCDARPETRRPTPERIRIRAEDGRPPTRVPSPQPTQPIPAPVATPQAYPLPPAEATPTPAAEPTPTVAPYP